MKPKMTLTKFRDPRVMELLDGTDHKILAEWANDCAVHVLQYFTDEFPDDGRPGSALETLKEWIRTGKFSMKVIRKASLDSHAAAREAGEDSPARSAARACGQAVAVAHVKTHAPGAAIYAQQAVYRAADEPEALEKVEEEREWQYRRLIQLRS